MRSAEQEMFAAEAVSKQDVEYRVTSIIKRNYKKNRVSREIPQCGSFEQIKGMI